MLNKIIVLFFIITTSTFADKPLINWYKTETAPFYIMNGEYKNKGIGDVIQSILEKEFSGYKNKTTYANVKRMIEDSKKYKNFITFGIKTKDREENMICSTPISVVSGIKIIYKKENKYKFKKYIDNNQKIDLNKLILKSNIVIGYSKERIFEESINKILKENSTRKNLEPLLSQNAVEGNIEKLLKERVDCIIENISVVEYYKKVKQLNMEYEGITIKDTPDYIYVYALLNKNEFGEKAVKVINKEIEKIKYREDYMENTWKWSYMGRDYKKIYIKAMREYDEKQRWKIK